jgi:NAD(P)-dependent dehydrogenase (short-subunit alcohol dehydrogenase family)
LKFSKKKIALITGGATRIGREISLSLAKNGWYTIIHYNSSESEAISILNQIKFDSSQNAEIIKANFEESSDVHKIIPYINQNYGIVDLLINNASYFSNDNILDVNADNLEKHLKVNLYGPLMLSQSFALQPGLIESNIINILDYCVLDIPTDNFLSYSLSKSALWTLTKRLAVELAPKIRVNAIAPGPTMPSKRQSQENFDKSFVSSPLNRGSTTEEICNTIEYIISTPSVTGQVIALDGGRHLSKEKYF